MLQVNLSPAPRSNRTRFAGSSGGHYGWRSNSPVPPKTVQSDAKGIARIEYPTYIVEGIRSTEVTFTLEHPKFSSDTPSVPGPAPLPSSAPILARLTHLRDRLRHEGAIQTITLRPGATVEISAYLPEETNSVSNIFAKVSSDSGAFYPRYWSREGSLLLTHQMPPSDILLQVVHFTSNNLTYFSEVQSFKAEAGKTNHLNLPLHPGIRLSGRLDSSVPRPVQHGLVNLRAVTLRKSSSNPLVWSDYSEVLPDGRFEFKSIPIGRIELLALCDGFISSNPTNARSMSQPQVFNLTNSAEISLSMNPVSIAEIKVIDTSGSPIAGADVAFWPNERWAEGPQRFSAQILYAMPIFCAIHQTRPGGDTLARFATLFQKRIPMGSQGWGSSLRFGSRFLFRTKITRRRLTGITSGVIQWIFFRAGQIMR